MEVFIITIVLLLIAVTGISVKILIKKMVNSAALAPAIILC